MNAPAAAGCTLSGRDELLRAFDSARSIRFSAYVLRTGRFLAALETAARRGADVRVTLEGAPYGAGQAEQERLAELNARTAASLGALGARVRLTSAQEPPIHLKAALVNGAAYLDDRNWTDGGDLIVRTAAAADVRAVASALGGAARSSPALATEKDRALALEAQLIHASRGPVECETESFSGCAVYAELKAQALAGADVRLLVTRRDLAGGRNSHELQALERLEQAGVQVRVGAADDKLCLTSEAAWVGSANASGGMPRTLDWGTCSGDPTLVGALRARFAANWGAAEPLAQLPGASQDVLSRRD